MKKFKASNGVHVFKDFGDIRINYKTDNDVSNDVVVINYQGVVDALREYFQAERDEELGRWRVPGKSGSSFIAIYPSTGGDYVRVVDELTGTSQKEYRDGATATIASQLYFEAHPVKKPWHDAKPGEVWVLNFGESSRAMVVTSYGTFNSEHYEYSLNDVGIVSARRVYPEVDDVEG